MISALKTLAAIAAAPTEHLASVIEARKATDFVMEDNFETIDLLDTITHHQDI